jgi:hypothetical protein
LRRGCHPRCGGPPACLDRWVWRRALKSRPSGPELCCNGSGRHALALLLAHQEAAPGWVWGRGGDRGPLYGRKVVLKNVGIPISAEGFDRSRRAAARDSRATPPDPLGAFGPPQSQSMGHARMTGWPLLPVPLLLVVALAVAPAAAAAGHGNAATNGGGEAVVLWWVLAPAHAPARANMPCERCDHVLLHHLMAHARTARHARPRTRQDGHAAGGGRRTRRGLRCPLGGCSSVATGVSCAHTHLPRRCAGGDASAPQALLACPWGTTASADARCPAGAAARWAAHHAALHGADACG